jgi:hypothetical protein
MSFQTPKIKILGITYQNKHGSKYYSKYYIDSKETKFYPIDFTQTESIKKFEQGLQNKIQRTNIMSIIKP